MCETVMKLGYVPYSKDLLAPSDRRRFVYFASECDLKFEVASINEKYDIILLTPNEDLAKWIKYIKINKGTKLIFEMTDSLIYSNDAFRSVFKGIGRFIIGKSSKLYFDYRTPIKECVKIANAVICSNRKVKDILSIYNNNVHISFDYFQEEVRVKKTDYSIKSKLKLVWDGQGEVLENFLFYKGLFKRISHFCELHIITDEVYSKYVSFNKKKTEDIIRHLPIKTIFHKWEKYKNYEIISNSDCGIIPINPNNEMAWHKPANKLISYWFCGLPTLVTNTPAYTEIMNEAGIDGLCKNENDWIEKIYRLYEQNILERENHANKAFEFVNNNYSDECSHIKWKQIFDSV